MRIGLISHCMDRSGAPVALMNLACYLKKHNHDVLFLGFGCGALVQELGQRFIKTILLPERVGRNELLLYLQGLDLIVINTLVLGRVAQLLYDFDICKIMWIHESDYTLYEEYYLPIQDSTLHYYAVGEMAIRAFQRYYPKKEINILPYYLPEVSNMVPRYSPSTPIRFAMIGGGYQKGEDVLFNAIKSLSVSCRKRMELFLVFTEFGDKLLWNEMAMVGDNIKIFEELSQDEIRELYNMIDVLICPSRCDTMPIVVSQAMQSGIPCIISDMVGHSTFITDDIGYVFTSGDAKMLANCIQKCIEHPLDLIQKGINSRKIFTLQFSENIFNVNWQIAMKTLGIKDRQ